MVDKPRLTPTAGSGGGRAGDVPTIRRELAADLRGVPTVNPSGLEAAARAFNVQAGVFGELQRQFQISAEEGLAEIKREQQVEAERMYSEKRLEMENSFAELEVNPELAKGDVPGATIGIYDTATEQALDAAKSPFQRAYLEEKFARGRTDVGTRAIRKQANREIAEREVDFAKKLELNQSLISASPDTYEEVMTEQMEALNALNVGAGEQALLEQEVKDAFGTARVRGLLRENPDDALAALEDEQFTQTLSSTMVAAAREDVEVKKTTEEVEAKVANTVRNASVVENLETKAAEGELTNTEILDNLEAGEINNAQAEELVSQSIELKTQQLQDQADIDEVMQAVSGLNVLTGTSSNKITKAYKQVIMPAVQNMEPDQAAQFKARFVSKTNKLPNILASEIKGSLKGGSSTQQLAAATLVQELRRSSPDALADARMKNKLAARDIAKADRIFSMRQAGLDDQTILETIERQDNMINDAERKDRQSKFRKTFNDNEALETARTLFDEEEGFIGLLDFVSKPDLPVDPKMKERLLGEMRGLAENYFIENDDMDDAVKYASEQLKRTYGVTSVGGQNRRLMKYAPENYYNIRGDVDYISEQLVADVNEIARQPRATELGNKLDSALVSVQDLEARAAAGEEISEEEIARANDAVAQANADIEADLKSETLDISPDKIFLVPDERTAVEAADGTPSYRVVIQNEKGQMEPLGNGRWRPDFRTKIEQSNRELVERGEELGREAKRLDERKIKFKQIMDEKSAFPAKERAAALDKGRERIEKLIGRPVKSPFASLEEFFFGDE